ncbi:Mu homology domain-containing protein [Sphaerosporella brunnea]|uniref:Mu homology domain-containing protein n=1 Tax=Sphaerosporella brunnea TaxID=1250544 RepID=A0A5J5EV23_9PEZI|nr:Mu homology domain-containing protein [Sphaerosporella brunnea]
MSYRLNTQVKPLIWVECMIESHSGSRIEYMLKAKAQFKRRPTANNVEIIVPVPEDADSPRFRTNIGSVHYHPEKAAIVWKIKQQGHAHAHAQLTFNNWHITGSTLPTTPPYSLEYRADTHLRDTWSRARVGDDPSRPRTLGGTGEPMFGRYDYLLEEEGTMRRADVEYV